MFSQSKVSVIRPFFEVKDLEAEKLLAMVTASIGKCQQERERGGNHIERGNLVVVHDVEGTTRGEDKSGGVITSAQVCNE